MSRESNRSFPVHGTRSALSVRPDVAEAIAAGAPVVALESTLITHGLPRPRNLEVASAAEAEVRANGAIPATIALRDGCIVVGLSEDELTELADTPAGKATRQNLAAALLEGGWWGTTVSATLIAAHAAGIRVFATGGIGGVHRGADRSFDVSADLEELARTPVAIVCAGPKAILDARATLEYLETRGVPVIGLATSDLPGFWSRESGVPVPITARDEQGAAAIVMQHWSLGLGSGVLVAVPIPAVDALPRAESEAAIARAIDEAKTAGTSGTETTPWLLARVAELTNGRSLAANASLIRHNAGVAARLTVALAAIDPPNGGGA